MNAKTRILTTLLVVVVGSVLLWKTTNAKLKQEASQVSQDSLSQALHGHWGAGLPAGYTREEADDLETSGYRFARLTYTKAVDELLGAWKPSNEAAEKAFADLTAAHLAAEGLPDSHRTLLETARPQPASNWLGYTETSDKRPGAQIALLYDPEQMVMYVAECWPMAD